ncbi:hypothetical protein E2C01_068115 [Portunus trituberculatus]|uniref:Uncharacterized protein n=1 Tax=Portunus trituberculatus TaxID=210409 RepID=A0A5B7HYL7_PORTR|nr:hypothetical protein [Portunus trituberculatus]
MNNAFPAAPHSSRYRRCTINIARHLPSLPGNLSWERCMAEMDLELRGPLGMINRNQEIMKLHR